MKKLLIIIFTLCITAIGFNSCKSSKRATEESADAVPEIVLSEVAQSITPWQTYSTSGKLTLSGAASFATSMQMKMTRDMNITISIRPILGIEVAKVFIDNDSAVIVNKYHKVYTTVYLDELKHLLPVNIQSIQDIILAQPFSLKDGTLSIENIKKFTMQVASDGYTLAPRKKQKEFAYTFTLNQAKQVEALTVKPTNSNKTYTAVYSDFVTDKPSSVASYINFATQIGDKDIALQLYLNPSKAKWDTMVDETLSISKSYRKISIAEHIELLQSL